MEVLAVCHSAQLCMVKQFSNHAVACIDIDFATAVIPLLTRFEAAQAHVQLPSSTAQPGQHMIYCDALVVSDRDQYRTVAH
jgi:hypothetical protein